LLALRRAEPALSVGSYRELWADSQLFAYERVEGPRRLCIALNFSATPCPLPQPAVPIQILLSTHGIRRRDSTMILDAHEGIVFTA
jgi:alpha-glucosidase